MMEVAKYEETLENLMKNVAGFGPLRQRFRAMEEAMKSQSKMVGHVAGTCTGGGPGPPYMGVTARKLSELTEEIPKSPPGLKRKMVVGS